MWYGFLFAAYLQVIGTVSAYTVRTLNTVQAWRLKKSILQDFMLSRPHHFLEVKQRLNAAFTQAPDSWIIEF